MKFETNPQLILSLEEFETLDVALKLCRDMDEETDKPENACEACPFQNDCARAHAYDDCVYVVAHRALKKIIDIAIVK